MAQQLIFTSAVAGLNPGSSGYCTVARSEAMREAVVTRLEQWSVYTHQAGGQNPVVCAYRVLNLRGSVFHVLTRIVDSGLDYTGRTNFLAHHLVFQPHEIHGACSPAEVFLQWPGWVNQWQGGPRYLEDDGLSLHNIPRGTKMPANTWKEWAGDAGAATLLLAEGGGSATARSTDLVVPTGSESVLPHLYAESLHLIDPKGENAPVAWAASFTTFLQSQDDSGDFRWRGLSPANRARAAGEVLIDLQDRVIPLVAGKPLAEYARTGIQKSAFLPGVSVPTAALGTNIADPPSFASTRSIGIKPRTPALVTERGVRAKIGAAGGKNGPPTWVWLVSGSVFVVGLAVVLLSVLRTVGTTTIISPPVQSTPFVAIAAGPTASPEVSATASPMAMADSSTPLPTAALQDPNETRRQEKLRELQQRLNQDAADQSLLQASQKETLDRLRQQLNGLIFDDSVAVQVSSDLDKLEADLIKLRRSQMAVESLPSYPVYVAPIINSNIRVNGEGLQTFLNDLKDTSAQYKYKIASSQSMLNREGAQDFVLQTRNDTASLSIDLNIGTITFTDNAVHFSNCSPPLCIVMHSIPKLKDEKSKVKFALIALDSQKPYVSSRVQLQKEIFLQFASDNVSIRDDVLKAFKDKLSCWTNPDGSPLGFTLHTSLRNPQLAGPLEALLKDAMDGTFVVSQQLGLNSTQREVIEKAQQEYQKHVKNSSYSVARSQLVDLITTWQVVTHPSQSSTPAQPKNWTDLKEQRDQLTNQFDAWMHNHDVSCDHPKTFANGSDYYLFLSKLLAATYNQGNFADNLMPFVSSKSPSERLEKIRAVPAALEQRAQEIAPKDQKKEKAGGKEPPWDKLRSLADVWRSLFMKKQYEGFILLDGNVDEGDTPANQKARPKAPSYDCQPLLDALNKNFEDACDVYLQATMSSNQTVRLIDFVSEASLHPTPQ